ncbi:secretion protein HlyD family protein [Nitrosococcus halophilus Nc 4]|uniref:Secretion protein HlyD family protein n=1 Tax=Nitrosococcus halophilus (strain Nc4) TaxID=472759 RepID=D5BXQ3_NITHN|nr:HlyD family efflux transporter periplasmic adaptor subunit [Nitrosococcus halophilus]ADE14011.1 secretion protein HlyD family protein [Nitrosococcus halophilus Nc 4]
MSSKERSYKSFPEALGEHSTEGIAILTSEPSRLMGATIGVLVALLLAGIIWSFVGRADVIVTTHGSLSPDSEARRFYAPIGGEIVDIYMAEGQPVLKGDVLARLNARGAIEAATNALDAELKLAEIEREYKAWPERKNLRMRQAEALKKQIAIAEERHQKRVSEGLRKLAEAQKARLEEARGTLDKAARQLEIAKREWEKYKRLFNNPGGGGVSKNQVEEKKSDYLSAATNYRVAKAQFGKLDYELSNEYSQAKSELEGSDQELIKLRIEYEALLDDIKREENRLLIKLRGARLAAEAASRIKFENIDEDNFLRILAPVSGVITEVTYTQIGDKVQANTPLGAIAPEESRAILKIEIPEQDRGFLEEGLPVKAKFSAFPYQRYGAIDGTLEYISPAAKPSSQDKNLVYTGHIGLEKTYFSIEDVDYPLRYGMTATAEIVVRERRLIDLALDPFRKVAG